MQLSKSQVSCRAPAHSTSTRLVSPPAQLRHPLLTGLAAASTSLLLLAQGASALDLASLNNNSSSSSFPGTASTSDPGSFIAITPINKNAKDYMDMRDDAMEYQCKGGMFDCDGDRRDFAHKQYKEWLDAGGTPKRIRDGRPDGPRAF